MNQDTIVALSSGKNGAIAIIRWSGEDAIHIVNHFFVGKVKLVDAKPRKLYYGQWVANDEIVDEVMVSKFISPYSFSGENMVELTCHGSSFIIQTIIGNTIDRGARMASPGEFTQRAFIHGKMDLTQAEAVSDLIASESKAQHNIALNQMRGGFSSSLAALREKFIEFASLIELELDFGEEDVEFANREELTSLLETISTEIHSLIDSFAYGNAIKEGVSVVLAGKPNAGKSSLLNALLNEDKAIVSEIAGTTRDSIEDVITIEGKKFRITDTAGLRETDDTIEAIGVERTKEKVSKAQILIYLFDLANTTSDEVIEQVEALYQPGMTLILAQTHVDLYTDGRYNEAYKNISERLKDKMQFQMPLALKGSATQPTLALLKTSLVDFVNNMKSESSVIVTNIRHIDALQQSLNAINEVKQGLNTNLSGDLLAQDIREALRHLGDITGEIDVDKDILGTIFGKFCIGK